MTAPPPPAAASLASRAWARASSLSACFGSAADEQRARELACLADLSDDQFRSRPPPRCADKSDSAVARDAALAARRICAAAHAESVAACHYADAAIDDYEAASRHKHLSAQPAMIDRYHVTCLHADVAVMHKDAAIRAGRAAAKAAVAGDACTAVARLADVRKSERSALRSALAAQEKFYAWGLPLDHMGGRCT